MNLIKFTFEKTIFSQFKKKPLLLLLEGVPDKFARMSVVFRDGEKHEKIEIDKKDQSQLFKLASYVIENIENCKEVQLFQFKIDWSDKKNKPEAKVFYLNTEDKKEVYIEKI